MLGHSCNSCGAEEEPHIGPPIRVDGARVNSGNLHSSAGELLSHTPHESLTRRQPRKGEMICAAKRFDGEQTPAHRN